MQKLRTGQIFALLDFLHTDSWDSPTGQLLAENILLEKTALNWIFENENNENSFFNCEFSPENRHVRLLRNRFLFARKLKEFYCSEKCYYARNNDILWNLLFSDLISLDIDRKSHLFLNLKNYLECGHYEKALKNPELLAKIFYLYYCSLKTSPNVPGHFLVECLKIVRILNPSHPASLIEYAEVREQENITGALDLLSGAYEKGCRDTGIILKLIELLRKTEQNEKIDQLAEDIFRHTPSQMKAEQLFQISNILCANKNYIGGLFFQLKGISIQREDQKSYSELRRIFLRMQDFTSGDICSNELGDHESERSDEDVVFIIPTELKGKLSFKFSALDSWQKLDDEMLFVPRKGHRTHVQFLLSDTGEPIYFFADDTGPYELNTQGPKIQIRTANTPKNNQNKRQYKYCNHYFCPTPDSLRHIRKLPFLTPDTEKE